MSANFDKDSLKLSFTIWVNGKADKGISLLSFKETFDTLGFCRSQHYVHDSPTVAKTQP